MIFLQYTAEFGVNIPGVGLLLLLLDYSGCCYRSLFAGHEKALDQVTAGRKKYLEMKFLQEMF